jgi:hypothetical protein
MLKKVLVIALCMMLALVFMTGCTDSDPVQTFIDDNREQLATASTPLLATMGEGATVDFESGDNGYEFIYIYTYGDFPEEGLLEILEAILDASELVYEMLADEFAGEIGVDTLTITVRYYDADGDFLTSRSFTN